MPALHLRAAGLLLPALLLLAAAAPVRAQEDEKPTVHRLSIFNGSERTVHFYAKGLNPNEQATLRALEQAENDLSTAENEQRTREERPAGLASGVGLPYPYGSYLYPLFYGDLLPYYFSNLNYILSDSAPLPPWWWGWPAYPAALPYTGWGYFNPPPLWGAYPWGLGAGGHPRAAAPEGGEQPRMTVAQARQRLQAVRARINGMDRLRTALNLPKREGAAPANPEVTVMLKGGKLIKGKLVRQTKDTLVVETDNQQIEIQRNDVATITRDKAKKME
jgi:hypothetical protein